MKTYPKLNCGMEYPKQFFALWKDTKGKWHQFDTNNEDAAAKKAVINDGEIYIDNRYAAKLRLYYYLLRKQLYPNDYKKAS
jgi:hypothetical protein